MKIFVFILLVTPELLLASDYKWTESCARTLSNMEECSRERFAHYDKQLNFYYQYLMKGFEPIEKKKLRKEQRQWLKSRDPYCKKDADTQAEHEAFWTMKYEDCRGQLTENRVKELREFTQLLEQTLEQ